MSLKPQIVSAQAPGSDANLAHWEQGGARAGDSREERGVPLNSSTDLYTQQTLSLDGGPWPALRGSVGLSGIPPRRHPSVSSLLVGFWAEGGVICLQVASPVECLSLGKKGQSTG